MKAEEHSKILIAEDSVDLLRIWTTLFRTATKYTVRACHSGASAREAVESGFIPEVLVTDYYLGDCTGVELIEQIRSLVPGIKVIMATGNHDDKVLARLDRDGELKLLIKPVPFKELREAIRKKLDPDPEVPPQAAVH